MKKSILVLLITCIVTTGFSQQNQNTGLYRLNVVSSKLIWKCAGKFGGGHEGTLNFLSGNININQDGKPDKGAFVINMNSLTNLDQTGNDKKDLEEHLKSDDFFAVRQYPQASFNVVSVTPTKKPGLYTIVGALTIKGKANEISFPATITTTATNVKATAVTSINRTKWGVNFQSESVFGVLKDGAISDDIFVTLDLTFIK
jgi:polyisoprenoid-binding protein YceI